MRTPLILAALLAVGGIGGTGHAAPVAPVPVRAAASHVALYAYAVDQSEQHDGLATPPGSCEDVAAGDRASCRKLAAAITDARRTLAYAELAEGWDGGRRAAFARLVATEEAYARAVGAHETAAGDGEAAARVEKDAFLSTLRAVLRGPSRPDDGTGDVVALDAGLNAAYARVMAARDTDSLGWGAIDKAGVRRTERAWLAYRDAFVAFAATLEAPHAVDSVEAELTRRRAASLEALLAD